MIEFIAILCALAVFCCSAFGIWEVWQRHRHD